MPSNGTPTMVTGIVGLVLGVGATVLALIFHYHPIISGSIGAVLLALGGAAVGYSYAIWHQQEQVHLQTPQAQQSTLREKKTLINWSPLTVILASLRPFAYERKLGAEI
jgi:uncharacterized protein YacL